MSTRFLTGFLTRWLPLATVLAAVAFGAQAQQGKTELLVYSALEADQIKAYKEGFERDNPTIELKFVRDSTGIVTAKLMAEKANPQADVIWGLAATSLKVLDREQMLLPYAPKGLSAIKPNMRDKRAVPTWVGMDVWSSAICVNLPESVKRNLPKPQSWADLTNPAFKGQITMPHPASSGTGFLMVAAWIQMMGEDKAWAYMDALHQNIGSYTHSGSKPCRQAGAGEYAVGLSFDYRANKTRADGAPIDIFYPREGLGWDMEAAAILKATRKPEAAKALMDWAVTRQANELYAKNFAVVAIPGVVTRPKYIPEDLEARLIKNDFDFVAANRERILAEWSRRYEGKAEKRPPPAL